MAEQRPWWTVEQVAETLQVNPETVRRWIRRGWLKARLLGKSTRSGYRIAAADLAEFMELYQGQSLEGMAPAA